MRAERRSWRVGVALAAGLTVALSIEAPGQVPKKVPAPQVNWVKLQYEPERAKRITTPFRQPEVLKPVDGAFELTLTKGRFTNSEASEVDPQIPPTFELLSYNGQRVGPTIRVKRGTRFRIRLKNALHGADDSGPNPKDGNNPYESVHGLCTTNLHTHGLHVSPIGRADNIFRAVNPGYEYTFEYYIGPRHPAGTYWYHPHKHGSVAYQLSNGVAGALIVEGSPGDAIADLDDIPEIAGAGRADPGAPMVFLRHLYDRAR